MFWICGSSARQFIHPWGSFHKSFYKLRVFSQVYDSEFRHISHKLDIQDRNQVLEYGIQEVN